MNRKKIKHNRLQKNGKVIKFPGLKEKHVTLDNPLESIKKEMDEIIKLIEHNNPPEN